MLRYSLYALAGAYSLQVFPSLPPPGVVAVLALLAMCAFAQPRYAMLRPVASVILGAAMMWFAAGSALSDRLDPAFVGQTLTITARVIEFPASKSNAIRLVVRPQQRADLPGKIRLSWYAPAIADGHYPALGELWQFQLRLKRPRGFSNPQGFDYEGWLFRQHIGATGYVSGPAHRIPSGERGAGISMTLRRHFAARIDTLFPSGESRAVLKAITVGARGEISEQQWHRYAVTGTSHLMAISGLHIGLAAGGSFFLVWALLALFPGRRNLRDIALLAALGVAFAYADLSGFAVPAKRALGMAVLAGVTVLLRRQISVQRILAAVCLMVLISDPLSIYTPGFMLSFFAVILLLWTGGFFVPAGASGPWWHGARLFAGIVKLTRMQLVLLLGLMPLTIALFGRVAILAPLTNMLVVPIFNLLTVPASLLGLCFDGPLAVLGDPLLRLAFKSVEISLAIIDAVGDLPVAAIEPPLSGSGVLLVSVVTIAWAVLPVGWPGRHIAVLAFAATLLYKPAAPEENCVHFHALDVGQGLAVVLRTRQHTLLYDTGPAFRGGSSTAKLVIGPFLKSLGISKIDLLVVSHSDLDHAGGVGWMLSHFDIEQLLLGEDLEAAEQRGSACHAGQGWQWDGVRFRIVHPRNAGDWRGNNGSCVLLVQAGDHKLLIPGDIESVVERTLEIDPVDMVVVPHHGSRTSSGGRFVDMLHPALAVVSAGYHNRWGFPKPDIAARWRSVGAEIVSTGEQGAISRRYCAGETAGTLVLERHRARRYWHDD